eukprot:Awhi_evm1s10646
MKSILSYFLISGLTFVIFGALATSDELGDFEQELEKARDFYGELLSSGDNIMVEDYAIIEMGNLLSIQKNYEKVLVVKQLSGKDVKDGELKKYVEDCSAYCSKNTQCFSFGVHVTKNSTNNECLLLTSPSLFDLEGFLCDGFCDSGKMAKFYVRTTYECPEEEYLGYEIAAEFGIYISSFGCNEILNSGDGCNTISFLVVDFQYNNTGCASDAKCIFLEDEGKCHTKSEVEHFNTKQVEEKMVLEQFQRAIKTIYVPMSTDVSVPENYLQPYTGLVSIYERLSSTDMTSMTKFVEELGGSDEYGNINEYVQVCADTCQNNSECSGFTIVYLPNSTENQCRLLSIDVVYGFSSLDCSLSEPCPSGETGDMFIVFIKKESTCPDREFYGYELLEVEADDVHYNSAGLFKFGCNPYWLDDNYCSFMNLNAPAVSLSKESDSGCQIGSTCTEEIICRSEEYVSQN